MNNDNNEDGCYRRFKRKLKSISERILLLDVNYYPSSNFVQSKILSQTNKEYCINIQVKSNDMCITNYEMLPDNENDILDITCNCMDFQMRKCICKHIYWFCRCNLNNIIDPKPRDLYDFLYKYLYVPKKIKGRNENCPICLEKIYYDNENYICCSDNCGNAVHNICWSRYKYISNISNCVLCRNPIIQ